MMYRPINFPCSWGVPLSGNPQEGQKVSISVTAVLQHLQVREAVFSSVVRFSIIFYKHKKTQRLKKAIVLYFLNFRQTYDASHCKNNC
jgi:hypothetical protein